jgi:uncharacterized protein YbjT (DUF2867 family)
MILVTGATGNVGSKVAGKLTDRGVPFRSFVRDAAKAAHVLGGGADIVEGDFSDPESVRRGLDGIDVVFLSCGGVPERAEIEGNVIDAAAQAGVRKLVKASAHGAEPGSPCAFLETHGRSEEHLKASGVPFVMLRSTFYMTELLQGIDELKASGMLFIPAGDAKIAMIDPDDVAAAAAAALTDDGHEGKSYLLSGPESVTFGDVAEQLSAVIGKPIQYVPVPDEGARAAMLEAGLDEWTTDNVVALFGLLRGGLSERVTDDVHRMTGRQPRSLADFVEANASALQ